MRGIGRGRIRRGMFSALFMENEGLNMQEKSRIYLSPPHLSGYEEEYIKEAFALNWIGAMALM